MPDREIMSVPEGWEHLPTPAFSSFVGPYYRPPDGERLVCGFLADERHGNKRGVVQGGMLATSFDVAIGNACWAAAGDKPCATVQLNIHYAGAMQLGEFAIIRTEVLRTTRSLVFARATMRVADRLVAAADGVWKILAWRGDPYVPFTPAGKA